MSECFIIDTSLCARAEAEGAAGVHALAPETITEPEQNMGDLVGSGLQRELSLDLVQIVQGIEDWLALGAHSDDVSMPDHARGSARTRVLLAIVLLGSIMYV